MNPRLTRRTFLLSSALAAPALSLRAEDKPASPNEKLHVGIVGTGGRGVSNWQGLLGAGAEIVAVCDVDQSHLGDIVKAAPKATRYADFRKMLDQKGIDAVVVSTPDHSHAVIAHRAMLSGRHVYCEKPLTHTVAEARELAVTAAKLKRVTQMGTQIHAEANYRRVVEAVRAGAVGKVSEVHVWCAKSWGGNGKRPAEAPVPAGLDYDLWLGPVAERPFSKEYHPFNWRRFWAFGGGTLADMACHYMDLPFWALKLKHPTKISAEGPPATAETAAEAMIAHWEFPAHEGFGPIKLHWYDGGKRPAILAESKLPKWGDGVLFVGDKGVLISDYGNHKVILKDGSEPYTAPAKSIPDSVGHYREFLEACQGKGTTTCNFAYSGALTETVLLGTVAYRLGRAIDWDAETLTAKGDKEAATLIRRQSYRKGFEMS